MKFTKLPEVAKASANAVSADIVPNDWDRAVAYGTLLHLDGLNANPSGKNHYKKDVLEGFLYAQLHAVETMDDGLTTPELYFKQIGECLNDKLDWENTDVLSSSWDTVTIKQDDTVLKAALDHVKSLVDKSKADYYDIGAFTSATNDLAADSNSNARDTFKRCSTASISGDNDGPQDHLSPPKNVATFAVAIITNPDKDSHIKASVYGFSYTTIAPVTDIFGMKNTEHEPITMISVHGSIKMDDQNYISDRNVTHADLEEFEGLYVVQVAPVPTETS